VGHNGTQGGTDGSPGGKSPREVVEGALVPLVAFTAFAGIIVTAITKGKELAALVMERPAVNGGLCAIGLGLVLWAVTAHYKGRIGESRVRTIRVTVLAVIIVVYAGVLSFSAWCTWIGACEPAEWRPVKWPGLIQTALAEERKPDDLVIEAVAVDQSRSSFRSERTHQSIHGTRDETGTSVV
jgi:hypothetical protein